MPTGTENQIESLLHRLIGDDHVAAVEILDRSGTSNSPSLLVAAALLADEPDQLLARAARRATTTRDRQLVAIAAARVSGDEELLDALVRDHLADHPDSILAAWIASRRTQGAHRADPDTRCATRSITRSSMTRSNHA